MMVWLTDDDIRTDEVRDWRGIHLLHFQASSCSQKTRIVLGLKAVDWTSHHVNLATGEHHTDWFMGINPRGLVPVLVHDGRVMIESNDILTYLEALFPDPPLDGGDEVTARRLLAWEDNLHLDFRAISFRCFFPGVPPRPREVIERYDALGSGTVQGIPDAHKADEIAFFDDMLANDGISDERIRLAINRFEVALTELDASLEARRWLMGDAISLVDIAWFIYAHRLVTAGYPLAARYPRLAGWFDTLHEHDTPSREIAEPEAITVARAAMHAQQSADGTSLVDVIGIR